MKRSSAYMFALLFSGTAGADQTLPFINEQLLLNQRTQATMPVFSVKPPPSGPLNKVEQDFIAQLQAKQRQQLRGSEARKEPRARYFLSFSIPHEGMQHRIHDAARLKVPATLRGLVNNNLQDTATVMFNLVKETQRGGVQIDPTAFRRYGITTVPALVVICEDRSDRISGNISLDEMLVKVAQEGDCAEVAKAILNEAEDAP